MSLFHVSFPHQKPTCRERKLLPNKKLCDALFFFSHQMFFSSPFSTFSPDIHHGSVMCEIILAQQHRPDYQHICSFNSFSQVNWIPATATLPNSIKYNLSTIFSSSLFAYSLHYKEFRNMHEGKPQWNLIVGLIPLENNTLFL